MNARSKTLLLMGALGAIVWVTLLALPSREPAGAVEPVEPAADGAKLVASEPPPDEATGAQVRAPAEVTGEPAAAAPEGAVAEVPAADPEEEWRQGFADASRAQVEAARREILDRIHAASLPELQRRWEAGLADYLHDGHTASGDDIDYTTISTIVMAQGGTFRVTLPAQEFPELYALKARADWLAALALQKPK